MVHGIAAFFDWDGTLSADGASVSPATVEAIHTFQQAGNFAFLCTGRSSGAVPASGRAIGFDGLVAAAGAYVRYGDRQLFRRYIPPQALEGIITHFLRDGQTCVLEGEQGMYVVSSGGDRVPAGWPRLTATGEFDRRFPGHVVNKLTLYGPMSPASEALLSAYSIIRHADYEEVMPAGCSKADGARRILQATGISRENCWAFGDSFNDLDMLRYAAVGVAMGNAPQAVKDAANQVTDPVEQDGVAHALSRLCGL